MKKPIFTIAAACACAHFALAEQVAEWFDGTTGAAVNGAWGAPPEGVAVEGDTFVLDDPETTFDFTPTAALAPDTNVVTRIFSEMTFTTNALALPTLPDGAKTAICVVSNKYQAKIGNTWNILKGSDPVADPVRVLVEMDYRMDTPKVRFGLVGGNPEATNYLCAADGEAGDWFTLTGIAKPADGLVSSVCYGGTGHVKSLSGKVQLGLFENNGVKYGTADEAVAAARASGGSSTITVLRDNDESIEIPEGSAIALDTNNKECGEVKNNSETPVQVNVSASDVAQGNGVYEIAAVDGKYTVYTSDTSKDANAVTNKDDGKVYAVITTKDSVIENQLSVAGKKLTVNDKLKAYLTVYGGEAEGSYAGKNSLGTTINTQLNSTPSGATRTMGQSYALGLEPTEAIVLQPAAADTSTTAVTLAMPNVDVNDDFSVTYQVQKHNGTTWVNDGNATTTPQIPVGSGRFRVNTVIAPKN